MAQTIYDFTARTMSGEDRSIGDYRGKVLLIVNTASACGFTPQFEGLEDLYKRYSDRDFVILGFPSNQFGKQDPGTNLEIATFCQKNYGVTFPMFEKVDVNGKDAHPLYDYLTRAKRGVLGTRNIKWNFTKFLVGRQGDVLGRYPPVTTPKELEPAILRAL